MKAIFKLNIKAVRKLLELGVDFNAKDIYGYTALKLAKELRKQNHFIDTEILEIIKLLENYGAIEN